MALKVTNLRKNFKYAVIEYMPEVNNYEPYRLSVQGERNYNYAADWYKTEQGAKAHYTKVYQNPKWGIEYPKPIWERGEF